MVLEVGGHRVPAHKGRQGYGVGAKALKRLDGVLLSGVANVAALGIQNHRYLRRGTADVANQLLKLVFGTVGGKVRNLGFEGQRQVGRGVHDGGTKVVDMPSIARRISLEVVGEFSGIRVQPHAQQRAVLALGLMQLV